MSTGWHSGEGRRAGASGRGTSPLHRPCSCRADRTSSARVAVDGMPGISSGCRPCIWSNEALNSDSAAGLQSTTRPWRSQTMTASLMA